MTKYMYHGTRTAPSIIETEGIRVHSFEERLLNVRHVLDQLTLPYFEWLSAACEHRRFWWLDPNHFHGIFLTDRYTHAWTYAHRAPEYLEDATTLALLRLRPNIEDKRFLALAAGWDARIREGTEPSVIVIDSRHPDVNCPNGGRDVHLPTGTLSPDTIVRIDRHPVFSR